MKFILLLSLFLSFSANALVIPTSLDLGDYIGGTKSAPIVVKNLDILPASLDVGTLQGNFFKMTNSCTCSLLRNRTCSFVITLENQPRVFSDYVITDSLTVNGQVVDISATVKALEFIEDSTQVKIGTNDLAFTPLTSIDYGTITAATTVIYRLQNKSLTPQKFTAVLPSGMSIDVANTTCDFSVDMGRNRVCLLALTLEPVVCAGNVYSEEFKLFGIGYKVVLPVTADFTGTVNPLCIP